MERYGCCRKDDVQIGVITFPAGTYFQFLPRDILIKIHNCIFIKPFCPDRKCAVCPMCLKYYKVMGRMLLMCHYEENMHLMRVCGQCYFNLEAPPICLHHLADDIMHKTGFVDL